MQGRDYCQADLRQSMCKSEATTRDDPPTSSLRNSETMAALDILILGLVHLAQIATCPVQFG